MHVVQTAVLQFVQEVGNILLTENKLLADRQGELFFQRLLFLLTVVDTLGYHIDRLTALQRLPEVFNGNINLFNFFDVNRNTLVNVSKECWEYLNGEGSLDDCIE